MIDTAGTIVRRRRAARSSRAPPRCGRWPPTACSSGPAIDRLKNSVIAEGRASPTRCRCRPRSRSTRSRCSRWPAIIADAIDAVFEDTSVSEIFGGDNQA